MSRLLSACQGNSLEQLRNRALILLLASAGLRRMKAAALTLDGIDLTTRTVEVKRGKGGKARMATISSKAAVLALSKYLRARAKPLPDGRGPRTDHVFLSLRARKGMTPSGISQVIETIGIKAQVDIHPHRFRHYWADATLSAGMGEVNVMELAGWSSSSMLQRYSAGRKQQRAVASGLAVPDLV